MLYNPPSGSTDPNARYVGKNVSAGTQGSKVPPMAIEAVQREIVNCITKAGLSPTNDDLGQLWKALKAAAPDAALVHRGTNTGSVNALVATLSPGVAAIDSGALYVVRLSGPNTGPATANLDGTGVKPVLRANGSALQPRDMSQLAILTSDGTFYYLANLAQELTPPGSGFAGEMRRFGYLPLLNQASELTQTFVAQFPGVVTCFSTLNTSPQNGNISNSASINVGGQDTSGAADEVAGGSTSIAIATVKPGQTVTVKSRVVPTQTPTFGASQYLNYSFLPA